MLRLKFGVLWLTSIVAVTCQIYGVGSAWNCAAPNLSERSREVRSNRGFLDPNLPFYLGSPSFLFSIVRKLKHLISGTESGMWFLVTMSSMGIGVEAAC